MEKKIFKSNVRMLIALCYVLNDFDRFNKELELFMSNQLSIDEFCLNLLKVLDGVNTFGLKNIRKFYGKHKNFIDMIDEYYGLWEFMTFNYNDQGKLLDDFNLSFFYQYFLANKGELDKILESLYKIYELGITKISFDEEIDFSNQSYRFDFELSSGSIFYLDNLEVIPHFLDENSVFYKSNGSHYQIDLHYILGKSYAEIIVNDLLFDVKSLPDEVSLESISSKIYGLYASKKKECNTIKNSVDLSVAINDLYLQYCSTAYVICHFDDVESKKKLNELLTEISQCLEKMRVISSEYDRSVSVKCPSITKEVLDREKSLYLKKRKES